MLHSQSEKQGLFTKKSKTLSCFAQEAFHFILISCSDVVPCRTFLVRKSSPVTESSLTRRRVKSPPKEAIILRFETKEQLRELVTTAFGITSRFGLRTRPPKLSEKGGVMISENVAINYIQGSDSMDMPIKMRSNKDGLDLIYTKEGFLKITFRYRCCLLHYNSNEQPLNWLCKDLMVLLMHFPKDQLSSRSCSAENKQHVENDDNSDWDDGEEEAASVDNEVWRTRKTSVSYRFIPTNLISIPEMTNPALCRMIPSLPSTRVQLLLDVEEHLRQKFS